MNPPPRRIDTRLNSVRASTSHPRKNQLGGQKIEIEKKRERIRLITEREKKKERERDFEDGRGVDF